MTWENPLTTLICAIATLAVFSFLIKDNFFYRLIQHAALGATIGMFIIVTWQNVLYPMWLKPSIDGFSGKSHWSSALWVLCVIPGSLWYFQLSRKYFWVSKLVSGLFVGVAAGLAFKGMTLLVMPQIGDSLREVNPFGSNGEITSESVLTAVNNVVFLVAMFTTLLYFFFSVSSDNPLMRAPVRVGRLAIMICLGAMFGATVMTRMAYLLERMGFLYASGKELVQYLWSFFA